MWRILLQILLPMFLNTGSDQTTQGPFANPFGTPQRDESDDPLEVDAEVIAEDGTVEQEGPHAKWDSKTAAKPTLEGKAIPKWRMPMPKCGALPFIVMIVIALAVGLLGAFVLGYNPAVAVGFAMLVYFLIDDLRSRSPYGPMFLILIVAAVVARIYNLYTGSVFTSVVVPAVVGIILALLVSLILLFFIERKSSRGSFFAKEVDVIAIVSLAFFAGWNWLIPGLLTIIICGLVSRYANKKLPFTAILMALSLVLWFTLGFAGIS